jgi:hypothetical protein
MAGFSILEGVNEIITSMGLPPSSSLDPSGAAGTSVQGQAQYQLEHFTKAVLGNGHACNLAECKKYTLGSTGTITLPSTVLRIKPAGPNQRRNWVQRGSVVWNAELDTDQFPAGDYFFDVWSAISFDSVEQGTQVIIMQEAARKFQQQMVNNPARDQYIAERLAKAEVTAPRITTFQPGAAASNRPLVPSPQQ